MSGEDEYESLSDEASLGVVMCAGAMAGMMEHCVMFPVDCVKTRMQALACDKSKFKSPSIFKNLVHIVQTEGVFRPIAGVTPMALGAGPAHAVYFACYEHIKKVLTPMSKTSMVPESAVHAFAGASATFLHDAVMTPAEVVKQRMQMCCSPYNSALACASTVYRTEGLGAFYRSYTTMLTMNIPFQATHFVVYEKMMETLNPSRDYVPWKHGVSGAMAGAVAATVTMPWDVCKTLLNTQEANVLSKLNTNKVVGIIDAFRTVKRLAGWAGFFQGWRARVMYQMPSTAISWSTYELFKYYLNTNKDTPKAGREDTIEDLKLANQRHVTRAGAEETDRPRGDTRLWDQIVTDIPRQVPGVLRGQVVRAESQVNTDLVAVSDRTVLPGYRT